MNIANLLIDFLVRGLIHGLNSLLNIQACLVVTFLYCNSSCTGNILLFPLNLQTGHQVNVNILLQLIACSSAASKASLSKNKQSFSYIFLFFFFSFVWYIPSFSEIMVVGYSSDILLPLMVYHELNKCLHR